MLNSSHLSHNPSEKPDITPTNLQKIVKHSTILPFDAQTHTHKYTQTVTLRKLASNIGNQ